MDFGVLGAITGLIGAGLQAQAQAAQLNFQYAHFNWEKQRANTQDRFAQAGRTDQYGNLTKYDPALNKWVIDLTPQQKRLMQGGEKEQLLQVEEDAPAARKVKRAVQQRAYEAKEPFLKASLGYRYDQPESEESIRSRLTGLMAQNEMARSKADQALVMRQAIRLGKGGSAAGIIHAVDQKLGNEDRTKNRMLAARNDALKEFTARQGLHEQQWGNPMKVWGEMMAQGGDIPSVPKSQLTDTTGAQQQAMLQAFNQGTSRVGSAFDSLAGAAGKSVDLSGIARALAGLGKGKTTGAKETEDTGGTSSYAPSVFDSNARVWDGPDNLF